MMIIGLSAPKMNRAATASFRAATLDATLHATNEGACSMAKQPTNTSNRTRQVKHRTGRTGRERPVWQTDDAVHGTRTAPLLPETTDSVSGVWADSGRIDAGAPRLGGKAPKVASHTLPRRRILNTLTVRQFRQPAVKIGIQRIIRVVRVAGKKRRRTTLRGTDVIKHPLQLPNTTIKYRR